MKNEHAPFIFHGKRPALCPRAHTLLRALQSLVDFLIVFVIVWLPIALLIAVPL